MSEDIAPYIIGFTHVTLGDMDGFTYDEDNEEPLFSWIEDGRVSSRSCRKLFPTSVRAASEGCMT